MFQREEKDVDTWSLSGPFPERFGLAPHETQTLWGQALAQKTAARPDVAYASADMECAAREVGKFLLEHGQDPARPVRNFIQGLCGVMSPSFEYHQIEGPVPDGVSDADVFAQWRASLDRSLAESMVGGNRIWGVWFGRRDGHARLIIASGRRKAHVEPVSWVPNTQTVTLEGDLFVPAERLAAMVTWGPYGFTSCERDPGVSLPRFRFQCPVNAEDESGKIELALFAPGRLLGESVATVVTWPKGQVRATYTRLPLGIPGAEAHTSFAAGFLQGLNALRERQGLKSVVLAAAQSQQNTRLAPHFFAAALDASSQALTDRVAMGLSAGWEVDGLVQNAHFGAEVVTGVSPEALLAALLDSPFNRQLLFDANISQAAVGQFRAQGVTGALITTYELFAERPRQEVMKGLIRKLNEARAKRGLKEVQWVTPPGNTEAALAQALRNGSTRPEEALDQFLENCAQVANRSFRGWVYQLSSLDDVEWPRELLEKPTVAVAVAVGHYRAPDEPWVRHVVLLSFAEGALQTVALR